MDHRSHTSSATPPTRPDSAMAEIVDKAIALMDEHGKDFATQYLIGQGIGFRIIERVLADPQFRRRPPGE